MTSTQTYTTVAVPFLRASVQETFKPELKHAASTRPSSLSMSINNYLKSEEEIETEFCYACLDSGSNTLKDGYIDIHTLDYSSGSMEENY